MNLIAFDGLPLWELPPEALYMLLFALSYGPIRLIWWRDYRLARSICKQLDVPPPQGSR